MDVKAGGEWKPGAVLRRKAGAWGSATFYRKEGGEWLTASPLSAAASAPAVNLARIAPVGSTAGITAEPSGGTAPYSYAWAKQSGDAIAADTPAGATSTFSAPDIAAEETRTAVFRCTITDALGQIASTGDVTVTIMRHGIPAVSITPASPTKTSNTASLTSDAVTATGSGALGPYSYAWSKVSGGSMAINSPAAAATTFTASGLSSSGETRSATFRCTVTDARGNVGAADVTVTLARTAPLSATVSPTSLSKNVSSSTSTATTSKAAASASGGVGPFSYLWSKVSGGSIAINTSTAYNTSFTATGLAQGETRTATFRCRVTDANGDQVYTGNVSVSVSRAEPAGSTATYSPAGGSYSEEDIGTATFTISCTESATWTWSKTAGGSANRSSGSSGTSITFSLSAGVGSYEVSIFTVSAVSSSGATASWTITLSAEGY